MKKLAFVSSVALSLVCGISAIAQGQPVLHIQAIPAVQVSFQGTPGTSYTIQSTTNLADTNAWQYFTTLPGNSSGNYCFRAFADGPVMVYRAEAFIASPAAANISLDASSPLESNIPANNTTQGQYLGLPVLVFDVGAQGDNLHLRQLTVNISSTGQGLTSAAYLYNGSTEVSSAQVSGGVAVFQNIADGTAGAAIPLHNTSAFTVKVDVTGLANQGSSESIEASVLASNVVVVDSQDALVTTVMGNAVGNIQTVFGPGPIFSSAGAPTIVTQNITAGGSTNSTFQYTASFNVNVVAIGESVTLGLPGSSHPSFGSFNTPTNIAEVYENGVPAVSPPTVIATWSQPANTTLSPDGNSFTVAENQGVTIPVSYSWTVSNPGANTYALELREIIWSSGDIQSVDTLQSMSRWMTPAE